MKAGAGDPFEDDDFDDEPEEDELADDGAEKTTDELTAETEPTETTTETLPYKYRRDGVQDGRDHGNIFLRDHAQEHVDELVDRMDDVFDGESVYKIDVLEAALLAADEPDRTVEGELREMGYGMK